MGGAARGDDKKAGAALRDWELIAGLAGSAKPHDQAYYAQFAPVMARIELLATAARRTRLVNESFGVAWTPDEIRARFADEDVDLLIAWKEFTER